MRMVGGRDTSSRAEQVVVHRNRHRVRRGEMQVAQVPMVVAEHARRRDAHLPQVPVGVPEHVVDSDHAMQVHDTGTCAGGAATVPRGERRRDRFHRHRIRSCRALDDEPVVRSGRSLRHHGIQVLRMKLAHRSPCERLLRLLRERRLVHAMHASAARLVEQRHEPRRAVESDRMPRQRAERLHRRVREQLLEPSDGLQPATHRDASTDAPHAARAACSHAPGPTDARAVDTRIPL